MRDAFTRARRAGAASSPAAGLVRGAAVSCTAMLAKEQSLRCFGWIREELHHTHVSRDAFLMKSPYRPPVSQCFALARQASAAVLRLDSSIVRLLMVEGSRNAQSAFDQAQSSRTGRALPAPRRDHRPRDMAVPRLLLCLRNTEQLRTTMKRCNLRASMVIVWAEGPISPTSGAILAFLHPTRPGTIPFGVGEGDPGNLLIPGFHVIKLSSMALERGAGKNSGNKARMLTAT